MPVECVTSYPWKDILLVPFQADPARGIRECSERSVASEDLVRVHEALFGLSRAHGLDESVRLRTTAKLLFASVEIPSIRI